MQKTIIQFWQKIGLLTIPIFILGAFYLYFDPFKVLYTYNCYYDSDKAAVVTLNRDYVSMEIFLAQFPEYQYDSFIFGNSRSLAYQIKDWQPHISSPQSKCFHFDAAAESIYGISQKFRYLKKQQIPIKNALIILDVETLQNTDDSKGHIFMKHPLLSGKNRFTFQVEFIKAFLDLNFFKAYLAFVLFDKKLSPLNDIPWGYKCENNEIYFSHDEDLIAQNEEKFYKERKEIFYKRDTIQQYSKSVITEIQLKMLNEIAEKLQEDKSNYKLIINPLYDQKKMEISDIEKLKFIFGQENIFDFSGKNDITNNVHNYYESSHYRHFIARNILDNIYKKTYSYWE